MKGIIIAAIVIAFLIVILHIPFTFKVSYDVQFQMKVKYLFFEYDLLNKKSDKKKKKKKHKKSLVNAPSSKKTEKSKTKKDNMFVNFYYNNGFIETVRLILDTAKVVKEYLNSLLVKHLVVKKFYLYLNIAGSDSADTAEKYGKISSVVYPALGFLFSKLKVKKSKVRLNSDFLGDKSEAKFVCYVSFKPFWVINSSIFAAVRILIRLLKVVTSNNENKKIKNKYINKSMKEHNS